MPAEAIFKVVAAYYLGLLPFIRLPYDVLSIPYVTRDYLFMKIRESREAVVELGGGGSVKGAPPHQCASGTACSPTCRA